VSSGFFKSVVPDDGNRPPEIDTTIAHQARVYDYLLGGKDHFAVDRAVGEMILQASPDVVATNRANRAFLGRAVRFLAAEAGIRQFLDIGTGIPSASNTHEVAQGVAPQARVVYVDNDPIVLAHARALLASPRRRAGPPTWTPTPTTPTPFWNGPPRPWTSASQSRSPCSSSCR
jgi:hypothetical protein